MSEDTTPRPPSSDPHAAYRRPLPTGAPPCIGRYEVLRLIGNGSFGRVCLAFDPKIERYVAIKMPKDTLPPDAHRSFLREARAIADIHHPNICPVYDADVHDDVPYIVMRYIRGGTLRDVIDRGPPTPTEAIQFGIQIARGLEAAHARGVVHRDLKPANVLHDEETRELLITDFGVARWIEAPSTFGGTPGTPAYMAPEQWVQGGPFGDVSPRTDVYSLGVLLFRLLTGQPLFEGKTYKLMTLHCQAQPRSPSEVCATLDPRLDAVCLKALAKSPNDRYASAKEFADALADYLQSPQKPK